MVRRLRLHLVSNVPTFDFVILQDLYKNIGKPTSWNYWQIRDSRTLFKMLPEDPKKEDSKQCPNALADCYLQNVSKTHTNILE